MRDVFSVHRGGGAEGAADPPSFKVVMIYDDLRAGQRAMHSFWTLVAALPDAIEPLQPQLWRFDLLEHPARFAWALAHSADADLLILSVSGLGNLPATAEDWLKQWLAGKHGKKAGIIALLGPAEQMDEPDSRRFRLVQAAARKVGLDFFAPLSAQQAPLSEPAADPQLRSERNPPAMGIVKLSVRVC